MKLIPKLKQVFRSILPPPLRSLLTDYDNPLAGLLFTVMHRYYMTDGCKFSIPRALIPMGFRSRFFFNVYEIEERVLVRQYVLPEDRVIELGACIGVISCITNKLLTSRNARHVVVEANPTLVPWIYRNRELNDCSFLVEFCAIAEGAETTFYLDELIIGGSVRRQTATPIQVPARSLRELEQKHGPFNVVIMDIEGGELDVLRDSEALLDHYRLVIVEFHDFIIGTEATEECRRILNRNGFRPKERSFLVEVWERDVVRTEQEH